MIPSSSTFRLRALEGELEFDAGHFCCSEERAISWCVSNGKPWLKIIRIILSMDRWIMKDQQCQTGEHRVVTHRDEVGVLAFIKKVIGNSVAHGERLRCLLFTKPPRLSGSNQPIKRQ